MPDASLSIPRAHRLVYALGVALAGWVGAFGTIAPEHVDWALPWLLPPLHARFFGAMYLSGAVFMFGALIARRRTDVLVAVPMTGIWTGMLLVASLFQLELFEWTRRPVWVWFIAYTGLPAFALWIAWRHRGAAAVTWGRRLPTGLRLYLIVQGVALCGLALGLLLLPELVVQGWPWMLPTWLARLYSAPFLAYGVGSILAARRGTYAEARLFFIATFVFAFAVVVASVQYRHLLAGFSSWVWFCGFAGAAIVIGTSALVARGRSGDAHAS